MTCISKHHRELRDTPVEPNGNRIQAIRIERVVFVFCCQGFKGPHRRRHAPHRQEYARAVDRFERVVPASLSFSLDLFGGSYPISSRYVSLWLTSLAQLLPVAPRPAHRPEPAQL